MKVTGCTLFVVDAGVDTGPIVAQARCRSQDDDTVETLHERIKVAERRMLVEAVGRMAREGWTVDGRRCGSATRPPSWRTRLAQVGNHQGVKSQRIDRLGALTGR